MPASLRLSGAAFASLALLGALSSPAAAQLRRPVYEERDHARLRPIARPAPCAIEPPASEVLAGRALNLLFRSAVASGRVGRGPVIALEAETLKGINLAPASSNADLGLIKNDGKLSWPLGLQEEAFDGPRNRIDSNMVAAVKELRYGKAPGRAVLKDLQADYQALSDQLDAKIHDLTPTDYILSRRYLTKVQDTIRTLQDPAVATYFDRSWASTVLTVGDLVMYMTRKGLEFAPAAAPGDDACYTSLYHSLRDFEAGLRDCR
jgi:hypothetical protein